MSAINKTSIANDTLFSLGQESIADIADTGDPNAVRLNAIFDFVVDTLLSYDWFFNRERIQLSQLVAGPAFGSWDYRYTIPADYLANLQIVDVDYEDVKYAFVREGEYVFTNQSEAYLKYNKKITDISKMPGWFCSLISAQLAYRLAPKITGMKEEFVVRMKLDLRDAWNDAVSGNGKEAYFEDALGDTGEGSSDVYLGWREQTL